MNLLQETEYYFQELGFDWNDVAFIGGRNFWISIENFQKVAATADYNKGYGAQEVAADLVIVFKDNSWLDRAEYDGAECWVYREPPRRPKAKHTIDSLCVDQANENHKITHHVGWMSLAELNK